MKMNIEFDDYRELCEERAGKYWGYDFSRPERWGLELVLDKLEAIGDPKLVLDNVKFFVDNLLFNAEIVKAEDFTEDGNYQEYWRRYHGDWDEFLQDCFCGDCNIAVIKF